MGQIVHGPSVWSGKPSRRLGRRDRSRSRVVTMECTTVGCGCRWEQGAVSGPLRTFASLRGRRRGLSLVYKAKTAFDTLRAARSMPAYPLCPMTYTLQPRDHAPSR